MKKKTVIISVVAVAVAIIAIYLVFGLKSETKLNFETTTVGVANISNSVTATGTIEPVTQVDVGTQVSGIVSKLYVDYSENNYTSIPISELPEDSEIA